MENRELALKAAKILEDKKARDIIIIDIREKASFADFFVLASGNSEIQIGSLSEEVEDRFQKEGLSPKGIEGHRRSGWILMDYGDVIVNLLTTEMRERYNIEKAWGDGNFISLEGSENE
ncbi:MAG: ribosome silencing factor [Anaerovoracaceae bacterium]|jgi:ribosome-associated protein|nr:ribosome silencing factor [Anaerovoracaceae bacterium]